MNRRGVGLRAELDRKKTYHYLSIVWLTLYSAYLNFVFCGFWRHKTEKCGVRMRFRDNTPTLSNVIRRWKSRGLRIRYKLRHTFIFQYKINQKPAPTSYEVPRCLFYLMALRHSLRIRLAYCCIISHGQSAAAQQSVYWLPNYAFVVDSPITHSFLILPNNSWKLLVQSISATSIVSTTEAP
jgi:hypothetical protein